MHFGSALPPVLPEVAALRHQSSPILFEGDGRSVGNGTFNPFLASNLCFQGSGQTTYGPTYEPISWLRPSRCYRHSVPHRVRARTMGHQMHSRSQKRKAIYSQSTTFRCIFAEKGRHPANSSWHLLDARSSFHTLSPKGSPPPR